MGGIFSNDSDSTNYITPSQLDSKGYINNSYLNSKGYVTSEASNLQNYYTKDISDIKYITNKSFSDKGYVTNDILNTKGYITDNILKTKDYVNTNYLNSNMYITEDMLNTKGYVNTNYLNSNYQQKGNYIKYTDSNKNTIDFENDYIVVRNKQTNQILKANQDSLELNTKLILNKPLMIARNDLTYYSFEPDQNNCMKFNLNKKEGNNQDYGITLMKICEDPKNNIILGSNNNQSSNLKVNDLTIINSMLRNPINYQVFASPSSQSSQSSTTSTTSMSSTSSTSVNNDDVYNITSNIIFNSSLSDSSKPFINYITSKNIIVNIDTTDIKSYLTNHSTDLLKTYRMTMSFSLDKNTLGDKLTLCTSDSLIDSFINVGNKKVQEYNTSNYNNTLSLTNEIINLDYGLPDFSSKPDIYFFQLTIPGSFIIEYGLSISYGKLMSMNKYIAIAYKNTDTIFSLSKLVYFPANNRIPS